MPRRTSEQWTPAHDERLAKMKAQGLEWSAISERLGYSADFVARRWTALQRQKQTK